MHILIAHTSVAAPRPDELPGEIKEAHLPPITDERLAELTTMLTPVRDTEHYPTCSLRRWLDLRKPGFFADARIAAPVFGLAQLATVRTLHTYPGSPSEADVLAQIAPSVPQQAVAYQWYGPRPEQLAHQRDFMSQTGLFVGAAVLYRQT